MYKEIKSLEELIAKVKLEGLNTTQESINNAADILGRAPMDSIYAMARKEPSIFYLIAKNCWDIDTIVSTYNSVNEVYIALQEQANKVSQLIADNNVLQTELKEARNIVNSLMESNDKFLQKNNSLATENTLLKEENIRLKARLYDLIEKENFKNV